MTHASIYRDEEMPCQCMFHDDPETGTYLMFERDLTHHEQIQVRTHVEKSLVRNSYWTDNSTLCILQMSETD